MIGALTLWLRAASDLLIMLQAAEPATPVGSAAAQSNPRTRSCRRWHHAGERRYDCLERDQWFAVLALRRSVFLFSVKR